LIPESACRTDAAAAAAAAASADRPAPALLLASVHQLRPVQKSVNEVRRLKEMFSFSTSSFLPPCRTPSSSAVDRHVAFAVAIVYIGPLEPLRFMAHTAS